VPKTFAGFEPMTCSAVIHRAEKAITALFGEASLMHVTGRYIESPWYPLYSMMLI
jgi:hypothetical protein